MEIYLENLSKEISEIRKKSQLRPNLCNLKRTTPEWGINRRQYGEKNSLCRYELATGIEEQHFVLQLNKITLTVYRYKERIHLWNSTHTLVENLSYLLRFRRMNIDLKDIENITNDKYIESFSHSKVQGSLIR